MAQDNIERMAREAGLVNDFGAREIASVEALARFADLIRADERERCAKICDESADDDDDDLAWHALNYRTAAPMHAEAMWQELSACVDRKVAAERERAAKVCDDSADDDSEHWCACASYLAAAIRG